MESFIKDKDIWLNSTGKLGLNFVFIKDFLKNLFYIFKKYKNVSSELNPNQMLYLNAVFNVNFNALKTFPTLFKKILNFALDFKNLKKIKLSTKEVIPVILDRYINKIYQKKFLIISLMNKLHLLIRVEHFTFKFIYDGRGRSYPFSSIFHYLDPLIKHFFGFGLFNIPTVDQKLDSYVKNLGKQILDTDFIPYNILNNLKDINLMTLFDISKPKNPFQCYLLHKDLLNCAKPNYVIQGQFAVDSCSSGFQIITMLLRSKKLAQFCGLIKNQSSETNQLTDFYDQFLISFKNHTLFVNNIFINLCSDDDMYNNFFMLTKNFVEEYPFFNNKSFCKNLQVNENFLKSFFNIYESLDIGTIEYTPDIKDFLKEKKNTFISLKKQKIYLILNKTLVFQNKTKIIRLKLNFILNILELLYEKNIINKYAIFIQKTTRTIVKQGMMTLLYGSSSRTRRESFKNKFLEQSLKQDIIPSETEVNEFNRFSLYLDFNLTQWIKTNLPESLFLINALRNAAKKEDFLPMVISTPHVDWYYDCVTEEPLVKSIFNHDYRLMKQSTRIDYKAIKNSWIANYIQLLDSQICSYTVANMKNENCPIITVHDCFRTTYHDGETLKKSILTAYKTFFDSDYLTKHFSQKNKHILNYIREQKKKYNVEEFTSDDIIIDNLVKH